MNWFPTPPTDNLYKFLAILGSWGVLLVLGSIVVLVYQNHEHAEFNKRLEALYSEESWLQKAEARITSLKGKRPTENSISGISDRFSPKEESLFLLRAVSLSKERLAQLKEIEMHPPANLFPFLALIHFDRWLLGILAIALGCFYYGFRQWLVLQRTSDELLRFDLILKKVQVQKSSRSQFRRGD